MVIGSRDASKSGGGLRKVGAVNKPRKIWKEMWSPAMNVRDVDIKIRRSGWPLHLGPLEARLLLA